MVQAWTELLTWHDIDNGTAAASKPYVDQNTAKSRRSPAAHSEAAHREAAHSEGNFPGNHFVTKLALDGLNVLGVDNSDLQLTLEQRWVMEQQLALNVPTLLMTHAGFWMPHSMEGLTTGVLTGDPRYNWDFDPDWTVEGRQRWPKAGNSKDTLAFVDDLVHTYSNPVGPVIGVFAGHEHTNRVDRINGPADYTREGAYQYVTQGAFIGGHRLIEVRDLRGLFGRCYLSSSTVHPEQRSRRNSTTPAPQQVAPGSLDVIVGPRHC